MPGRSVGSKPQAEIPSLEHQSPKSTQITSKWQGYSLPGIDNWRCKELFKGPMHKFSFAATYPGLWQWCGGVQSGLEMPEERLGTEALGKELR